MEFYFTCEENSKEIACRVIKEILYALKNNHTLLYYLNNIKQHLLSRPYVDLLEESYSMRERRLKYLLVIESNLDIMKTTNKGSDRHLNQNNFLVLYVEIRNCLNPCSFERKF